MEDGRRDIRTDLTARISSITAHLKVNEPLKDHSTLHIGGPAKYFVQINSLEELRKITELCREENSPFFLLGGGSNVLFDDHGFEGVVAKLSGDFLSMRAEGCLLTVSAGVSLGALLSECAKHGLGGLEFLAGMPGTVGGALAGNAGGRDVAVGDLVRQVELLGENMQAETVERKSIDFKYRSSSLAGKTILGATFLLKKTEKNDILKKIDKVLENRRKNQPQNVWSAGSVFKNPPGDSAGRLIEACGLKGLKFGGAQVSERHANFIVNFSEATAEDVKTLISMIHRKVQESFGISLELEVKLIGRR